jgi:hypothetical protein
MIVLNTDHIDGEEACLLLAHHQVTLQFPDVVTSLYFSPFDEPDWRTSEKYCYERMLQYILFHS